MNLSFDPEPALIRLCSPVEKISFRVINKIRISGNWYRENAERACISGKKAVKMRLRAVKPVISENRV
jgi:hypothetical protein